jgi:hypothetical protein
MRLRQYFHPGPTQSTNHRMLDRCGDSTDYEVSYVTCDSADAAMQLEATLLAGYVAEHGELPPENRALPRGKGTAAMNPIASTTMVASPPKASSSPRADVVWGRIEANAGANFTTVTGLPFSYTVTRGAVRPSRTNRQIPRSDLIRR